MDWHLRDKSAIKTLQVAQTMVGKALEEVTTLDWGMTYGIRLSMSDGSFFTFHGQYDEATLITIGETD